MAELLTAAQMRAVEGAAIDRGDVTGLELMERAGRGVVEAIFEEWPEFNSEFGDLSGVGGSAPVLRTPPEYLGRKEAGGAEPCWAVILCGPGNNGGDGFVVARLLHNLGWRVEVFLYGDAEKLPPDARTNYERWLEFGGAAPMEEDQPWGADLYIDAGFGTGLTRPMPEALYWALSVAHQSQRTGARLVAIDQPSSLCTDSGKYLRPCYDDPYDLTVSFHRKKLCHFLAQGPAACGKVVLVDIGLGDSAPDEAVELVEQDGCGAGFLLKQSDGHKFDHGHALILSGGFGKTGAARLTARGALRIGAGLVTLGVPGAAQMEVASQITALMLRRVEDDEGLAEVLRDARLNALCLGPGMGQARARDLVPVALAARRATVLDADALSAFADDPGALFAQLHDHCVLTPHGGEFARLFPDIAAKLAEPATKGPAFSKVDAARAAAKRAGCVVLFKGVDTVIASPDGRCSIHAALYERAAPWLATAGSGDVLAGFITGLLARGLAPMEAAESGAWMHVECARQFGPGLIAEDLPEQIPHVLSALSL